MEIVRLRSNLHLVRPGSGDAPAVGQVYVWADKGGITMIDSGVPGSEDDLAAAFAELGYYRSDLRRVVITHCHEDHAGSAAALRAWGDVEVLAHAADAPVIRGERPRAEPVLTEAERPIYDAVTARIGPLPPCPVDTELGNGSTLDLGEGARVIATPGHTDGSIAVWMPAYRILFTGDIVANSSRGVILGPGNTDRERAQGSADALARIPASIVGFGHGDPLTGAAGERTWRDVIRVPDPLGSG